MANYYPIGQNRCRHIKTQDRDVTIEKKSKNKLSEQIQ